MKAWIRSLAWGASWGLAQGFWLLAPLIVSTHHLTVETPAQSAAVIAVLGILFATLGALIGLVIYAGLRIVQRTTGSALEDQRWGIALATGIFLVPGYVVLGCLIYIKRFGRIGSIEWCIGAITAALPAMILSAGLLLALHGITSGRFRSIRGRLAIAVAAIAAVGGATALIFKLPKVAGPSVEAKPLARLASTGRARRPLLIVGIDGGAWRPIEPLLQAGRLATFSALMNEGSYGDMKALWPPYWSTTSWSAIITGLPREEVGVYGNLVVDAPGLPAFQAPLDIDPRLVVISAIEYGLARRSFLRAAPPERAHLKRPPVWEMLDRSGVKTGVIRFAFSHPAQGQAAVVISNRVVEDLWDLLGVAKAGPEGIVWPDSRRDELLKSFSDNWTPSPDELQRILPQEDLLTDPGTIVRPLPMLKKVLAFDQRTVNAAADLLKSDPDLEVLMIHFGGLDNVQHVFWQFRFPEDFERRPDAKRIKMLGPVIDRYIEFLDGGLGQIIAAFPTEPNVMVISDHGMESVENRPPFKAWHSSRGIFIAAGPDFPHHVERLNASYYDVVPTILDLKGLAKPTALKGRSLARPAAGSAQR